MPRRKTARPSTRGIIAPYTTLTQRRRSDILVAQPMTDERTLPFAGTPEELEKYLLEFARLTGGIAGRQLKGGWRVSGGAWLSTNPNTVPWTIDVTRTDGGLSIAHRAGGLLPWTR